MESKNDAPKVIIQLILGALVYYFFTFRFREFLVSALSMQVYYQTLVIIVIINSYIAKWIDNFRLWVCHEWMMCFSKKYKAKHYKQTTATLLEKSKRTQLSEKTKQMVEELAETDIELESEISGIYKDINKFKQET